MPQTDAPVIGVQGDSRLRWWTELPLILLVYGAYALGRMLVRSDADGAAGAIDHGEAILHLERLLHIAAEEPLNRFFSAHASIALPSDYWYATLHYIVTPAVIVWIYRTRTVQYRIARTWLLLSTFIGLIGFTVLPTCPPRLLAGGFGFTDTMAEFSQYGWWGGAASAPKGLANMTNQFAAMPSLHVGWALWCGLLMWRYGRSGWTRAAAVGYPLGTTLIVMGTANHYLLDALAGVAVMGVGLLLTRPALRLVDAARVRFEERLAPEGAAEGATVWAVLAARVVPGRARQAAGSPIVGDGCQTSPGERIPNQRSQRNRRDRRSEPAAQPAEAGDGAAAAAR